MNQPLVSVVIATYHRLYVLAGLMESLSRQMHKYLDIIIVNEGGPSPDILPTDYPELPMKNFRGLLEEPEVKEREAKSEIVWDGKPFVSRLDGEREG
ncbi:glycosyltransferase family 2 protein [Bacillus songklensis]|uniref:Glycosyltransferase family 2 protein n=1 Tax=Bacillus songklensis TaxID=1069116 RepID=A0ABV8B137_9BACI